MAGIEGLSPAAVPLVAHLITAAELPPGPSFAEIRSALRDHVFPRAERRSPRAPVLGTCARSR